MLSVLVVFIGFYNREGPNQKTKKPADLSTGGLDFGLST
jgi:hypothetical protein